VSLEPVLRPLDGIHEKRRGLSQRIDDLALSVPLFDLGNPVLERHQLSGRAGSQITIGQRIRDPRFLALVSSELVTESAQPDLESGLRVVSDEPGQPFSPVRPDVMGAVELM